MIRRWTPARAAALVALATVANACGNEDGRFRIEFVWEEGVPRPNAGEYLIEADVVYPNGQRTPAEPVTYQPPDVEVSFANIQYGTGLIVEIRFVRLSDVGVLAEPPVRYFGRSQPFTFEAGVDKTVPVDVHLTFAPDSEPPDPSSSSLVILNAEDGRIATTNLRVQFMARGAEAIEVSQDFLFQQGTATVAADRVRVAGPDESFDSTYEFDYDLNARLERCAEAPLSCEGNRQVYVRAVRTFGEGERFESLPEVATVILGSWRRGCVGASVGGCRGGGT